LRRHGLVEGTDREALIGPKAVSLFQSAKTTGIGIAAEQAQGEFFEPFKAGRIIGEAGKYGGTGWGFSISREIVRSSAAGEIRRQENAQVKEVLLPLTFPQANPWPTRVASGNLPGKRPQKRTCSRMPEQLAEEALRIRNAPRRRPTVSSDARETIQPVDKVLLYRGKMTAQLASVLLEPGAGARLQTGSRATGATSLSSWALKNRADAITLDTGGSPIWTVGGGFGHI